MGFVASIYRYTRRRHPQALRYCNGGGISTLVKRKRATRMRSSMRMQAPMEAENPPGAPVANTDFGNGKFGYTAPAPRFVPTTITNSAACRALTDEWGSRIASLSTWRGSWYTFPVLGRSVSVSDEGFPLSLTYEQWSSASYATKLNALGRVPSFGPGAMPYSQMISVIDSRCDIISSELKACRHAPPGAVGDPSPSSPPSVSIDPVMAFIGGIVLGAIATKVFV